MNKKKTHKGIAKRIRVTKTGKVMFHPPGKRHLLSSKSGKRKRRLRRYQEITGEPGRTLRSLV
ncbi:MAG: 50S ribosomal protein L35 [Planctomycetota bacterium]